MLTRSSLRVPEVDQVTTGVTLLMSRIAAAMPARPA